MIKKSDDIDTKKLDELGNGLFVGTPSRRGEDCN